MDDLGRAVAADFGAKLRAAREKAGLTQEALADLCGLHRTVISPLERGEHMPRLDTLLRLSGALGVEPCSLVSDYRWEPVASDRRVAGSFKRVAEQ